MTYEYENLRPVDINGFPFTYDVKSFRDYAYLQNEDSHSDGAAISRLLALHHLAFPAKPLAYAWFICQLPITAPNS